MDIFLQNLKYGLRMLRRSPGFAVVAIVTLALGIGANTVIFSVVHGVLLNPFPYADQGRLVQVWQHRPKERVSETLLHGGPEYLAYRDQVQSLAQMATVETVSRNITIGGEQPERVGGAKVSEDFFTLLGVAPVAGRPLLAEEHGPSGRASVVIGYGLWQRRFGGDPNAIGRTIELDNEPYQIVGVMPTRFRYGGTEFWFPFPFHMSDAPRARRWYQVLARLKPGATLEQANAELATIARRIEQEHAATNPEYTGWNVTAVSLRNAFLGRLRPAVLILSGAVGLVLLIACANVSSLLLARAASRQHEVAIRAAVGASRSRLVAQFVVESSLLAVVGGGLGLLLGAWLVDSMRALLPEGSFLPGGNIPAEAVIQVSTPVLWFTAAASVLTVFLFGLWPALQATRLNLADAVREMGRSGAAGRRQQRARNLLVVSEISLALVLLVGAGLLLRSFFKLVHVDPGFRTENVLTLRLNLPPVKYSTNADRATFFGQLIEQVRSLLGVESAAVVSHTPFMFNEPWPFSRQGEDAPEQRLSANQRTVSPDYFRLMGIPLRRGRFFTEVDREGQPAVAIINETMARRFWPDRDPLGQVFTVHVAGGSFPHTIVGVAADALQVSLDQPIEPEMNFPMAQAAGLFRRMNLLVRTSVEPAGLMDSIRQTVWKLDKQLPMYGVATMDEMLETSASQRRFAAGLLGLFAGLALVLALAGIYGVMAYNVAQRTQEFGIRMALGAQRRDVTRMVLGQGLRLIATGAAVGLVVALAAARGLDELLYATTTFDAATYAGVTLLLAVVSLAACVVPARRATRVDPMVALRYE